MLFLPNLRTLRPIKPSRLNFVQDWLSSNSGSGHFQQVSFNYGEIKSARKLESVITASFKRAFPLLAIFNVKWGIGANYFSNLNKNTNQIEPDFANLGEVLERLALTSLKAFPQENMSKSKSNVEAMAQLENNAQTADNLIQEIYTKLAILQNCNPELGTEVQNLLQQNDALKQEVGTWKEMLILQQIRNGGNPFVRDPKLIERSAVVNVKQETAPPKADAPAKVKPKPQSPPSPPVTPQPSKKVKKEKSDKSVSTDGAPKATKSKSGGAPAPEANEEVDIGRLDLRIGLIKECTRHPDADALYVEKIDVGEENVRTVISGLVKHVPLDAMQNRMVVVLCNLKPSKMRGITSEAMVMCASTPDKVEILTPPKGSAPGDVIEVDGYVRRPDAVLNPKKKIFETVAPDLKTNGSKQATYKGVPWTVPSKGIVVAESLINVNIK